MSSWDGNGFDEYNSSLFHEILGQQLVQVILENDGHDLYFFTPDSIFHYEACGDCCSESWVEYISDNVYAVSDAIVQEIYVKHTHQDGTRQESDEVDFVTLVTDKGYFDIEFRNSSNGYYGGFMVLKGFEDASQHFL